jgi:two-component system response regulator VanR
VTIAAQNSNSTSQSFRVLVIEDDPSIARVVLTHLSKAGFDCRYACDSSGALDAVEEASPHLVLLDIEQPDISGFMLCAAIRRQSKAPIVLMCPIEREEDIVRGFQAGADMYVLTPVNPKILVARVIAQLRRSYRYGNGRTHSFASSYKSNVYDARCHTPTVPPAPRWIECDTCRYRGPEQKFHKCDKSDRLVLTCPHCSERARAAFAVC